MRGSHRILILVAIAVTGCRGTSPSGTAVTPSTAGGLASPVPAGPATHGVKGAVPASHEDWCGEHQVPESLCSRCDPSLIPAFKATRDWCVQHGLPESQCLKCHPDLAIVRPPKGTAR